MLSTITLNRSLFIQPSNSLLKQKLRAKWHAFRANISHDKRQAAAKEAACHLNDDANFQASQHIACYFSFKGEFDSLPIIKCIWQARKICYLPVIANTHDNQKHLLFSVYQQNAELEPNRYGILEPTHAPIVTPEKLDMVIMPLLAADLSGYRLGSGGGYYDRTFASVNKVAGKPLLMGLGYAEQIIEQIPHDPWDVKLNGVITEEKIFYCQKT